MKTPEGFERVAIVSDDDGHEYAIPHEKEKQFYQMLDETEGPKDPYSNKFNDKFSGYRQCGLSGLFIYKKKLN